MQVFISIHSLSQCSDVRCVHLCIIYVVSGQAEWNPTRAEFSSFAFLLNLSGLLLFDLLSFPVGLRIASKEKAERLLFENLHAPQTVHIFFVANVQVRRQKLQIHGLNCYVVHPMVSCAGGERFH